MSYFAPPRQVSAALVIDCLVVVADERPNGINNLVNEVESKFVAGSVGSVHMLLLYVNFNEELFGEFCHGGFGKKNVTLSDPCVNIDGNFKTLTCRFGRDSCIWKTRANA